MSTIDQFNRAVASDLTQLAALHDRELDAEAIDGLRAVGFPGNLSFRVESPAARAAATWLQQSLAALSDEPQREELAADFAAIYLNHTLRASPCESVWIDEDGLAMQGPMFQIRGWYKRFGLAVPNWRKRSDDHLVHQLDFLVHLFVHTDGTEGLEEAARFMDEHPLRWMERFSHRVASRAATPFYAGLSVLTAAYLDELRDVLADVLETSRPTAGEIDRRMKPTHEEVVAMPDRYVPGTSPSW